MYSNAPNNLLPLTGLTGRRWAGAFGVQSFPEGRYTRATENQYYIPQGYLRGFTIPQEKSLVWEYDKERGRAA
jgi:hypothetical protein